MSSDCLMIDQLLNSIKMLAPAAGPCHCHFLFHNIAVAVDVAVIIAASICPHALHCCSYDLCMPYKAFYEDVDDAYKIMTVLVMIIMMLMMMMMMMTYDGSCLAMFTTPSMADPLPYSFTMILFLFFPLFFFLNTVAVALISTWLR